MNSTSPEIFDQHLVALKQLATEAAANYHLPPIAPPVLINLSENATYRIDGADGRRWALRIHREGYHSRAAIASELAWLIDLRARQVVATPVPVAGRDGQLIQRVASPLVPEGRHAVLFHWESGREPGITEDLAQPFEVLGEVAARMHGHSQAWARPPGFQRLTWDFETSLASRMPHWGRWQDGLGMDAQKADLFARTVDLIGARLAAYGKGPNRFGLVHCDLRLANLLLDGDAVKVIDFDDCGFSWFMYDAATPVSFYEHEPQVPELIEAWKAGYRKVRPLDAADEAEIPTFIMLRRLLLVAWIGSHSATDLARSMGVPYTEGTVDLCERFLVQGSRR